jgi:hypothetical protein
MASDVLCLTSPSRREQVHTTLDTFNVGLDESRFTPLLIRLTSPSRREQVHTTLDTFNVGLDDQLL